MDRLWICVPEDNPEGDRQGSPPVELGQRTFREGEGDGDLAGPLGPCRGTDDLLLRLADPRHTGKGHGPGAADGQLQPRLPSRCQGLAVCCGQLPHLADGKRSRSVTPSFAGREGRRSADRGAAWFAFAWGTGSGFLGEPAIDTGVIDVDCAVDIAADERLVGGEEDVASVGSRISEVRDVGAVTRAYQRELAVPVLVDIRGRVLVIGQQRILGVEEHRALVVDHFWWVVAEGPTFPSW